MEAFALAIRKAFRYSFYCLAGLSILLVVLPTYKIFLQSSMLGVGAGIVNVMILAGKVWTVGLVAEDPNLRPKGTGTFFRFMVAGIAAYLTFLFPHIFTLSGVLIGLFGIQGLMYLIVFRNFK